MASLHDMVKMTVSGTPGTGTITLLAAVAGFQTFTVGGVVDQDVIRYGAIDPALPNAWERGRGKFTLSGTTLARTLVSSSTGGLLSLTSTAIITIALLAEDLNA
jgi:hypothetical protein